MHPEIPADIVTQTFWDKYGLAGIAIVVFAGVISFLFSLLMKSHAKQLADKDAELKRERERADGAERMRSNERETHAIERAKWEVQAGEGDLETARIREASEREKREFLQQHTKDLHELRREFQGREDEMRHENSESAERMSAAHVKAMEQITAVVQKIYDRFIGPRARRGG